MPSNNLQGSFPKEMGLLTGLLEIGLAANALSGTLPAALGLLTKLTSFNVEINSLEGTVPEALGAWKELQLFGIADNQFEGMLPASASNWRQLTYFTAYNNRLAGGVLPALPFSSMLTCNLLDHADGGSNDFDCPWPEGAKQLCVNFTSGQGGDSVFITDDDCTQHK